MNIHDKINSKLDLFYRLHSGKPNHIYLGRTEKAELEDMIDALGFVNRMPQTKLADETKSEDKPATVLGMKVFFVDKDNHLEIYE
jgi:hypothetical protein